MCAQSASAERKGLSFPNVLKNWFKLNYSMSSFFSQLCVTRCEIKCNMPHIGNNGITIKLSWILRYRKFEQIIHHFLHVGSHGIHVCPEVVVVGDDVQLIILRHLPLDAIGNKQHQNYNLRTQHFANGVCFNSQGKRRELNACAKWCAEGFYTKIGSHPSLHVAVN